MIPIKIEVTNPSNIGSFKNTPCCKAATIPKHNKPVAGSRRDWHKYHERLSESLVDINDCSKRDLCFEIKSHILQSDRWSGIAYSVDNDESAGANISNEIELDDLISDKILPACLSYATTHNISEIDINRILSLPEVKRLLDKLNSTYKTEYSEVLSVEDNS